MSESMPQMAQDQTLDQLTSESMKRLTDFAQQHGWSLNEALRRTLDIADLILHVYNDPSAKLYAYQGRDRYALKLDS